jgi:TonB family protein
MRLRFWLLAWMIAPVAPAFAADNDAACTTSDAPLKPIMATHTMAPYPQMSVMTKEEGTTLLDVTIGPDGVPADVKVADSSGSIRLDQAAMDHVKANWRWSAPVVNCKPATSVIKVSIKWSLQNADNPLTQAQAPPTVMMDPRDFPPEALARHEQGTVVVTIYVLTDGTVALTRVIQTSGFPDLDAKAQEVVKTRHWSPAALDGHPVNTSLIVLAVWKLPGSP